MKDLDMEYLTLQNGSDIRGVAVDGVEGEPVNLTPRVLYYIGQAFAAQIIKKSGKEATQVKIAIGHDSRISAQSLKNAAILGLHRVGVQVLDCTLASTPAMFMSTVLEDVASDGALMLTASHLPYNRNGVKLFTADGGYEKEQIAELLVAAGKMDEAEAETAFENPSAEAIAEQIDLMGSYSKHLCDLICKEVNAPDYAHPLMGLHIVLDAGNGAGGFFASRVLEVLGADTTGSQFLEPDGMFPNHIPNPEKKEAMDAIRKATVENHADLGLIFDTDADRAAAVFSNGEEINRNAQIALMAAIISQEFPYTTVVTDSVTSDELAVFLQEKLHMRHHRYKRGYRNVINEAIRLNNEGVETHLAMETSGHGAIKENYFLDDGAYLCVRMVAVLAKCKLQGGSMEELIADLEYPAEAAEYRFGIKAQDVQQYGTHVLTEFMEFCSWQEDMELAKENYEGVRVSFQREDLHGWMLLRMSLHDPIMPFNIEAKEVGGVAKIVERVQDFFAQCDYLDISSLQDA